MEGFGQTETTLLIGNLVGDTPRPGSMGKPTPQYDVKVMLPDGTLAEPEEEGRNCNSHRGRCSQRPLYVLLWG